MTDRETILKENLRRSTASKELTPTTYKMKLIILRKTQSIITTKWKRKKANSLKKIMKRRLNLSLIT